MKKAVLVPYDKYQRLIGHYEKTQDEGRDTNGVSVYVSDKVRSEETTKLNNELSETASIKLNSRSKQKVNREQKNKNPSVRRIERSTLVKPPGRPQSSELKRKTLDPPKNTTQSRFMSGWITL